MGQEICVILGQFSHNLLYWKEKTSTRIFAVREKINQKTACIQARSFFVARNLENNGKARQAEGEAKVVESKAPSGERTKIARDLFYCLGVSGS